MNNTLSTSQCSKSFSVFHATPVGHCVTTTITATNDHVRVAVNPYEELKIVLILFTGRCSPSHGCNKVQSLWTRLGKRSRG